MLGPLRSDPIEKMKLLSSYTRVGTLISDSMEKIKVRSFKT